MNELVAFDTTHQPDEYRRDTVQPLDSALARLMNERMSDSHDQSFLKDKRLYETMVAPF